MLRHGATVSPQAPYKLHIDGFDWDMMLTRPESTAESQRVNKRVFGVARASSAAMAQETSVLNALGRHGVTAVALNLRDGARRSLVLCDAATTRNLLAAPGWSQLILADSPYEGALAIGWFVRDANRDGHPWLLDTGSPSQRTAARPARRVTLATASGKPLVIDGVHVQEGGDELLRVLAWDSMVQHEWVFCDAQSGRAAQVWCR